MGIRFVPLLPILKDGVTKRVREKFGRKREVVQPFEIGKKNPLMRDDSGRGKSKYGYGKTRATLP